MTKESIIKVLLTEPIHEKGIKLLEKRFKIKIASNINETTIIDEVQDCHAMIVRLAKITDTIIKNAPNLEIIARHGVGIDNIDLNTANKKGIIVTNAPESNIDSVAEHAMCMILALAKNLLKSDIAVRKGDFEFRNQMPCTELKGKTIGVIGLGRIGKALAEKIKALDVKIIVYDPYLTSSNQIPQEIKLVKELDNILINSDVVTVHVPLTKKTFKMIGRDEFRKMKNSAIFINVSRGGIVDEAALFSALRDGEIKAAGIDVFEKEPPDKNNQLFKLDNIILSPHNAALTEESMIKMATTNARGILDYFNQKRPDYIVN